MVPNPSHHVRSSQKVWTTSTTAWARFPAMTGSTSAVARWLSVSPTLTRSLAISHCPKAEMTVYLYWHQINYCSCVNQFSETTRPQSFEMTRPKLWTFRATQQTKKCFLNILKTCLVWDRKHLNFTFKRRIFVDSSKPQTSWGNVFQNLKESNTKRFRLTCRKRWPKLLKIPFMAYN